MKPDVQKVMMNSFERLMTDIAPHLTAEYAVGSTTVIGLMMFQTATEFERAAEIRVQENAAIRKLCAEAALHVSDDALKAKLREASTSRDPSLRISELDKVNDALTSLLIELHAHVELVEQDWARDIEADIWTELARAAEARRLPHPMVG